MEQNVFHRRFRELVALADPKAFEVMAFEIGNNVLEEGTFPSDTFIVPAFGRFLEIDSGIRGELGAAFRRAAERFIAGVGSSLRIVF